MFKKLLLHIFVLLTPSLVWCAPTPNLKQTQSKMQHLDEQIKTLRHTLASAHDKKGILDHELAETEKQMSEGIRKLNTIQQEVNTKQEKIEQLQQKTNSLNQQLLTQQQLLAQHVRARYQMGEYQVLKWLIDQDEPYKISRILTYYKYMIHSRKDIIAQIDKTKRYLSSNKKYLEQELKINHQLQHQLSEHQRQLTQTKNYHAALIHSLDTTIKDQQLALNDFQRDKENLARLLQTLAHQSQMLSTKPFIQMHKKLPKPVLISHPRFKRMNQGVTFFADEGAAVTAVYPGKVVFSDWLKGYGYYSLLIMAKAL